MIEKGSGFSISAAPEPGRGGGTGCSAQEGKGL